MALKLKSFRNLLNAGKEAKLFCFATRWGRRRSSNYEGEGYGNADLLSNSLPGFPHCCSGFSEVCSRCWGAEVLGFQLPGCEFLKYLTSKFKILVCP